MTIGLQVLNRVSLRTQMPTARAVLQKVHKQVHIVEPTYRDIVLLYRCAAPLAALRGVAVSGGTTALQCCEPPSARSASARSAARARSSPCITHSCTLRP